MRAELPHSRAGRAIGTGPDGRSGALSFCAHRGDGVVAAETIWGHGGGCRGRFCPTMYQYEGCIITSYPTYTSPSPVVARGGHKVIILIKRLPGMNVPVHLVTTYT